MPGAGPWQHMVDREERGVFHYAAWRRATPLGPTEYRSLTTLPDCSVLEYADFSLDDEWR